MLQIHIIHVEELSVAEAVQQAEKKANEILRKYEKEHLISCHVETLPGGSERNDHCIVTIMVDVYEEKEVEKQTNKIPDTTLPVLSDDERIQENAQAFLEQNGEDFGRPTSTEAINNAARQAAKKWTK